MKTLIDRMADDAHCQLLTRKYGCSVSTAGGPGYEEVTDYLDSIPINFGADVVGCIGTSISLGPKAIEDAERKAFDLGQVLVDAIATKRVYPDQKKIHEERREHFKQLVKMNKEEWLHEYDYWSNLGWL